MLHMLVLILDGKHNSNIIFPHTTNNLPNVCSPQCMLRAVCLNYIYLVYTWYIYRFPITMMFAIILGDTRRVR